MDHAIPKDIRFRARQWAIDLHAPGAGESERRACQAWRAEDPRHEKAFRDAQRVWSLLGELPAQRTTANSDSERSRYVGWAGRIAAGLAVLVVGVSYLAAPPDGVRTLLADVHTAPGEQRTVTLDDGTILRLNGASALSYRLESHRREIRLIVGEAHFSVAHDSSRPMFVEAADARIRVTGTRFDVQMGDGKTTLTLEEGSVAASRAGTTADVRVKPGEQVVWQAGKNIEPVLADMTEALAWQRGRLIFKSRPLGEVIDELARYRRGQTFVIGGAASELVTGVFQSSDPDAVLAAVERTLDVRVMRVTPLLTIIF